MADPASSHAPAHVAAVPERTSITLIRHGESEATVDRIIGGKRSCRGLSPLGRAQAERLRERLLLHDSIDADALISSDFPRAIETADIIRPAFDRADTTPSIDQWVDLGEHDPGPEIDGMTFEAYVDRYGTPDWSGDPDIDIFPGGETTRQFQQRVAQGLTRLRRDYAGRHVAVVCHGGVVDAAFRVLLDLPMTAGFELYTLNTALTAFTGPANADADDSPTGGAPWRLERYNDATHLAGLPDATPRRE